MIQNLCVKIFIIYLSFGRFLNGDFIFDTTTVPVDTADEYISSTTKPPHLTVLGALSNANSIEILNRTTMKLSKDLIMSSESFILDSNVLLAMSELCRVGDASHAKVIITGQSANDLVLSAIAYVSDFYHVPLITIGSRENIFSDENLYDHIIRLAPPYFYEADAWFSIIRKLKYTKVVLIHSHDEESRMVAERFQLLTDDSEIQIERIEEYPSTQMFTSLIYNLTMKDHLSASVFIIHTKEEDVDSLLTDIARLQQMENFVWIVNERTLVTNSSALFDGILGVKLHHTFNEENLLIDATELIMNTFMKFRQHPVAFWSNKTSVLNCSSTKAWQYGNEVYQAFVRTSVEQGLTGNITFNNEGDRIESLYEIINVQYGDMKVVGTYRSNTRSCTTSSMCRATIETTALVLKEEEIIWSNGLNRKPDGIRARRNVSVVTIEEKPFIFTRPGYNCDPTFEVYCPRLNLNSTVEQIYDQYCCYGYCIAMLQELSKNLSFVFTLYLVPDGKYGTFEREGNDTQKRWDGMIRELLNRGADMIVAPLTMSPERAEDIEFTKPFKYHGITVLVRKNLDVSNLKSFLQPFKNALWMMVLLSVHVVAVVLYLLDRFSPDERRMISRKVNEDELNSSIDNDDKDDALNLPRALWFTWGVLLSSGIGEGTPRSFSARVLGMVWAGFTMIMVASYTANLAAFLVLDRPEAGISGINDARLRNPQDGFTYATVKGSSVDMYFKRQVVEFSTMYRTMESKNYLTVEEAISDVKNKKLDAFFWDSPRLEYEVANDCNLITAGELFGRSSYGIALRKQDPWINLLSHAILSFHEKGFMEKLDNQWIFSKNEDLCFDRTSSSPATLGLDNMSGVFYLVVGGILVGFILLIVEVIIKRQKERLEHKSEVSRTALIRWKKKAKDPKRQQPSMSFQSNNQQQEYTRDNIYNELFLDPNGCPIAADLC
ncbi:unnamed protein product [Adineta ricciae]|uniref:Uncharacterized protein n=1 Tax=Adineta ricciae TaxID=249248 RepID=A0A813N557_ADIRI|nr:unnamed protein product [Adineta ricciae]